MFNGKPILIEYDPAIRRWRLVHAGLHGAVRGAEMRRASQDEMLIRFHEVAAEYGLVAHLDDVTDEAIRFRVGPR